MRGKKTDFSRIVVNSPWVMTLKFIWRDGKTCLVSARSEGFVKLVAKKTDERRYCISSRDPDIKDFSESVCGHRGIENSLHWVMDIVFRDDDCRVREKNAAANFVTLKHITMNMLKSIPGKMSMRVRWKVAGRDDGFLYKAISATPGA